MSPAAQEVFARLARGTFEVDVERLADAILRRFQEDAAAAAESQEASCPATAGSLSRAR